MTQGPIDLQAVEAAIAGFKDPETGRDVLQTKQISDIAIKEDHLSLTLALTTHSAPIADQVRQSLAKQLEEKFPQLSSVQVSSAVHQRPPGKLGDIGLTTKSAIAVGSGKGGVGKSTIATILALGLKRAGCQVGLMDADVYGPSIPHLLGLSGRPEVVENKIQPLMYNDMPVMSMGFLVPEDEAVVWRGPMLHGAITQFLRDTEWGELDYLIIDMPPGTGDIALTLSQMLPLTGAVVVCTPQKLALLDAVKAIVMFQKVNIPILGMVENMSGFICPDCGKRYDIFGSGGAKQKAEQMNIPFLGEVPIQISIRTYGDEGNTNANFDDPKNAPYFEAICCELIQHLADSAAENPPIPSLPVLG